MKYLKLYEDKINQHRNSYKNSDCVEILLQRLLKSLEKYELRYIDILVRYRINKKKNTTIITNNYSEHPLITHNNPENKPRAEERDSEYSTRDFNRQDDYDLLFYIDFKYSEVDGYDLVDDSINFLIKDGFLKFKKDKTSRFNDRMGEDHFQIILQKHYTTTE